MAACRKSNLAYVISCMCARVVVCGWCKRALAADCVYVTYASKNTLKAAIIL